jgi:hypothetical protein
MASEERNFKTDLSGSDDRKVSECRKDEESRVFRSLPEPHGEPEERDEEYSKIDARDKLCVRLLQRTEEHVKSDHWVSAYECAKLVVSTLEEQIKATTVPKVPLTAWKDS